MRKTRTGCERRKKIFLKKRKRENYPLEGFFPNITPLFFRISPPFFPNITPLFFRISPSSFSGNPYP
jgi:hypothetical protein